MSTSVALPDGISQEALLASLRPLCWGAADILRAYARGEQPPHGFPKALSVDDGGEGPVSAADLAVNQWLLDGLQSAFPSAGWTLLSEETAKEQLTEGEPLAADWLWILDPLDGTKDFLQGTGEYAVHLALVHQQRPWWAWCCCWKWTSLFGVVRHLRRPSGDGHRCASVTEPRYRSDPGGQPQPP